MAYKAAIMDPNAIFLVSNLSPPNRGFYSGTVGGPPPAQWDIFRLMQIKLWPSLSCFAKRIYELLNTFADSDQRDFQHEIHLFHF